MNYNLLAEILNLKFDTPSTSKDVPYNSAGKQKHYLYLSHWFNNIIAQINKKWNLESLLYPSIKPLRICNKNLIVACY